MRLLIRNGTVVTAEGSRAADVLVDGETIAQVGPGLTATADRTLDAAGRHILPGGIDVHTHLDMPYGDVMSADDFASGTIAAAMGGTTTIIDFAVQDRGGTLHQAVETWQAKAGGKAAIDYGFHVIVTDVTPRVLAEMDDLVAEGITTFKLFMAYPGRLMLDDAAIFRVLLATVRNGGMVMMHAENGGVIEVLQERALAAGRTEPMQHALTRPPLVEAEAAHRAIAMAEIAGAAMYIVHVSAAETVEEIAAARARGLPVFGETCPQYLFLTDAAYEQDGARFIMSPPLRDRRAQERLWRGLLDGELQAVATDHCPFTLADKHRHTEFSRVPGGAPGIETRMPLLFGAGRLPLERFVAVTATEPAKIFGLYPRKGTIAPGSDADLVIWDPTRTQVISAATHHMRVDYNPYEGQRVKGVPETVLLRGRPIVEGGAFRGEVGAGRFLRRATRG
ncbi:MAG TPA: dihydropyrimidinase [Gemmatimonadales bacterium]|nr:dihydropyrimidinase [Gemmatimonadales bacterium]